MQQMDYLIDFNLEVLHGCKWNCTGCNVQKTDQDGFLDNDFDCLMRLFEDLEQNHHILSNVAVTPTDFMAANNGEQIFTMDIKPMFDKFCAVTLNTTFLQDRDVIERWASILRPILKGNTLKFSIPVEPEHYSKKKYMDIILGNRDYLVSLLPETNYTKTYLIGNLHEYRQFKDFDFFSEDFHNRWQGGHLDIVITEGRLTQTNPFNRQRLRNMVQYQNSLYDQFVTEDHGKEVVNFTYGKRHEGYDKDYVYKNGKIYAPVFLGEPLVIFEESYALGREVEWNTANLVDFENQMLIESLEYVQQTTHCGSCEFAPACSARGLLKLMKTLNVKECFAPRSAFVELRQVA